MKKVLLLAAVLLALILTVTVAACLEDDGALAPQPLGNTDDFEGRSFGSEDRLLLTKVITDLPQTIEATVRFPADFDEAGGVILSNYDSGSKTKPNTFYLYVDANGAPVLSVRYDAVDANRCDHTFSSVDLYTGEWVNIAVVRDGAQLHCYVDGALMQTLDYTAPEITMTRELFLGGDYRSSKGIYNAQYFKGAMKSLALWSEVRTAEEIAADITATDVSSEALVAYYELEGTGLANIIPDLSKQNNTIIREVITGGLEFTETVNTSKNRYYASKALAAQISTIEVMMRADEGEYGTLYSSYSASTGIPNSEDLVINKDGTVKYSVFDSSYDYQSTDKKIGNIANFTDVNVLTGEWLHLAIVTDIENMKCHCYINGVVVQSVNITNVLNITPKRMYIARDARTGQNYMVQYTGEVMSLAAYSDARTEREIKNDIMCGPEHDENLLCYYDMTFADDSATIPDRSGNAAHLVNSAKPVDELAIEGEGLTFENLIKYPEKYTIGSIPHTLECTFKLDPENYEGQKTILSNYKSSTVKTYTYSLRLVDGTPRLIIYYSNDGSALQYRFDEVTQQYTCTGEWVNLAITMDTDKKEFKCYINGSLSQTVSFSTPKSGAYNDSIDFDFKFIDPLLPGASYGTGSAAYPFSNGRIKSIVTYSDVRTADEIAGDVYFPGTDGMTSYWDMEHVGVYKDIPDRSNNHNNMKVSNADTTTYDNEKNAMTFTKDKYYETVSKFETTPLTIEAKVKYPTYGGGSDAGGKKGCGSINNVILGNYYGKTTANVLNFGINVNSNPTVYVIDHLANQYTFTFDEVKINTEYWEHIAITFDAAAGYAYCYQNGVLMQMIVYNNELSGIDWSDNEFAHVLGGDWQSERREYFKRKLAYVALYTDIRDAAEIYADAKDGISADDDSLMCYYDCVSGDTDGVISDNKSGKYNLKLFAPWVDVEERDPESYDYSIAVVGDTQNLTYYYPEALTTLYDWIVANAESKKIGFVMGVGDINEKDSDAEWILSSAQIEKLRDAGIPQSLVCGGTHDSIPQFNKYLPYTEYVSAYEGKVVYGFYDDGSGEYSLSNAYQLITIGQTPYMFLTLEWAPKAGHVAWANEVIAAHPEYNVIISTHAYLAEDGTPFNTYHHATPDSTGAKAAYNGAELWNELIRRHENIVMVLGGHDTSDFVVKREVYGDHGNRIVQMLINPQHTDLIQKGTGMVAMLYFSDGGRTVDFEYYSTVQDKLYREENQFSFEMPKVETDHAEINQATVSLGNDIKVNYYARLVGKYENAVMRFTLNGETATVSPVATEYEGLYRFTFSGIAPHLMGDGITAELILNDEVILVADQFSIEGYLKALLKLDRYELSITARQCEALHTLVVDMLDYGAAAQAYRNYNSDSPVNEGVIGGTQFDAVSVESVKSGTAVGGDGTVRFTTATVRFDSINSLRFDFAVGSADPSELTVIIGDRTYTEADFILKSEGVYSIYTDGIGAVDFDKAITASIYLGGEQLHSVTYSINSYVKTMYANEKVGELAQEIWCYGRSAITYIQAFAS